MTKTILIGLTGSIGMGKSTVASFFLEQDVPVWDADAAVHCLYAPGGQGSAAIHTLYPDAITDIGVDRSILSAGIATDPSLLSKIESVIHPLVAADRTAFINNLTSDIAVCDIPLLFEKGSETQFDMTVVVSAPPEIQRTRVLARPGMTPEKFDTIQSRQMPDAEKRARADHVIDTGATLEQTRAAVIAVIARIRKGANT